MDIQFETYNKALEYIDVLINNQNNTDTEEFKNALTKQDFLNMLKEVLDSIKNNQSHDINDIRNDLFQKSFIKGFINQIVNEKKITPGMVIDFGTLNTRDIVITGNKSEYTLFSGRKEKYTTKTSHETIYDLASTSKLFTSLLINKLAELGFLNLDDPITKHAPMFRNLNGMKIYDLLKFTTGIITTKRIDTALSVDEAENILFNAIINPNPDKTYAYTDIGSMVLKYVVEGATGTNFHELAKILIFDKANMKNTHLTIPYHKLDMVASNNFNTIINSNGEAIESTIDIPGTNHDPKAKMMKQRKNNAPGHAGYFSNTPDMINLSKALIENKIVSKNTLTDISKNLVGGKLNDQDHSCYLGSLVFLKQPSGLRLPLRAPLSGQAFASPGFGGSYLCVDPLNEISLFIGANRLHNRIYRIPEKYVVNNQYQGKYISRKYPREILPLIEAATTLSVQYQFLEILLEKKKNQVLVREI